MRKHRKRISTIITVIFLITIVSLLVYMEVTRKAELKKEASMEHLTEVEKLVKKDLVNSYPETPREVIKYYSAILKELYSGIKDEEVEELADKVLELYDEEFLQNNPKEKYMKDLYSEIAAWNKDERTITYYVLLKDEEEVKKTVNERGYAIISASYTIKENEKKTEVRKYLLRQDKSGKWKILGWETVPKDK